MQLTVYSLGVHQIANHAYLQDGAGISDNFQFTYCLSDKEEQETGTASS